MKALPLVLAGATQLVLAAGCSQSESPARERGSVETAATSLANAAGGGGAAESKACGASDQPDCPLQGWMKANPGRAMKAADFVLLERAFRRIERMNVPGYEDWTKIAHRGVVAAVAENLEGCRETCRSCHETYRAQYRNERRSNALP